MILAASTILMLKKVILDILVCLLCCAAVHVTRGILREAIPVSNDRKLGDLEGSERDLKPQTSPDRDLLGTAPAVLQLRSYNRHMRSTQPKISARKTLCASRLTLDAVCSMNVLCVGSCRHTHIVYGTCTYICCFVHDWLCHSAGPGIVPCSASSTKSSCLKTAFTIYSIGISKTAVVSDGNRNCFFGERGQPKRNLQLFSRTESVDLG